MSKKYNHDIASYDLGLVINSAFLWLGASPDGKVKDVTTSPPIGLIEIKCLYTYRYHIPHSHYRQYHQR